MSVYDDQKKIRSVFFSLVFAFITWMIAANMLAMVLFGVYKVLMIYFPVAELIRNSTILVYAVFFGMSLFFDTFMHFTPFVAFFQARTEDSLWEAFTYSLFGRRIFFSRGTRFFS